ncbi:hypothetical protein [Streptomyces gilvus]|uniref:hypothetical protein n=1 Tax=Streptomyces gilvus TaxID=2920937 RepID=UPI0027E4DFED|nr:hypothetical protein [Streptomyces sp. CME 23]
MLACSRQEPLRNDLEKNRPRLGPLVIRHGLGDGRLTAVLDDGRAARVSAMSHGTVSVGLSKGREVLLHTGPRPDLTIAPVAVTEPGAAWGLP